MQVGKIGMPAKLGKVVTRGDLITMSIQNFACLFERPLRILSLAISSCLCQQLVEFVAA